MWQWTSAPEPPAQASPLAWFETIHMPTAAASIAAVALVLWLLWPSASRRRAAREDDEEDDADWEGPSLMHLIFRQIRAVRVSPQELMSSLLTSLGSQAFVAISSFATLLALLVDQAGRRFRRFSLERTDDWISKQVAQAMRRARSMTDALRLERVVERLHRRANIEGSGQIGRVELYVLVLELYQQVGRRGWFHLEERPVCWASARQSSFQQQIHPRLAGGSVHPARHAADEGAGGQDVRHL